MPRGPAHADDQIPARRGPRILGQAADDLHAEVAGGFEAEGRRRAGQGQIVVDGLGHVGDADLAGGAAIDLAAREGRVVAADGDDAVDLQAAQDAEHVVHRFGRRGRIGARRPQDGAAAEGDLLDVFNSEPADVFAAAFDELLEAVANAEDVDAVIDGLDGDGTDDAVDAGRRSATHDEGDLF